MPNIWFTADFHLGHKNIIRYCNRPFDTVEEMNRTIIERLKSLVKTNDILYFLGDFCIGPKAKAVELRREIRCKNTFAVPGNHDKDTRKLTQEFSWLGDLAEVSINGQRIVLCHYAVRVWNHPGICTDTRTGDCPASMHHFRWMSAWTPMIFVRVLKSDLPSCVRGSRTGPVGIRNISSVGQLANSSDLKVVSDAKTATT
jgi:calcineurin-like phosphoesterase family protein